MNKRGISTIIGTIIMVALVMAAGAIIWGVISSSIEKQTESTQSCFNTFGKISIDGRYTCYDDDTPGSEFFQFSITRGDIDLQEIVVLISSPGQTKSFVLNSTHTEIPNLEKLNTQSDKTWVSLTSISPMPFPKTQRHAAE